MTADPAGLRWAPLADPSRTDVEREATIDIILERIWWNVSHDDRLPLRCPFRGDVPWRQLPLKEAAEAVILANEEQTRRRRRHTLNPASEAEVTLLAALLFYGEDPILQHPVGPYDLDFYIADYNVAIEVDGRAWHTPEKDERRDRRVLEIAGIITYRVPARDAIRDPLWAVRYTCKAIIAGRRAEAV